MSTLAERLHRVIVYREMLAEFEQAKEDKQQLWLDIGESISAFAAERPRIYGTNLAEMHETANPQQYKMLRHFDAVINRLSEELMGLIDVQDLSSLLADANIEPDKLLQRIHQYRQFKMCIKYSISSLIYKSKVLTLRLLGKVFV